jgi:hypothetical protein
LSHEGRIGALLLGLLVVLVPVGVIASVGPAFGEGAGTMHGLPSPVPALGPDHSPDGQNCSNSVLASVAVTPNKVTVLPLAVQSFSALAESACGSPLTQNTTFSWRLSSVELGALNATAGAIVAYSACVAPMDGVLHLEATAAGVTVYANSSIAVSAGTPPPPNTPSGPSGTGGPATPPNNLGLGIGIMAACFVTAGGVVIVGRRPSRRSLRGR